jgi:phospholipid/cholesterol/gamma-HCH transport system permease protein
MEAPPRPDDAVQTTGETERPRPRRPLPLGGRFIGRGQFAVSALLCVGQLLLPRRSAVTTGVVRETEILGIGAIRLVASASILVGLITTFQVAYQLSMYGAESLSALSIGWFGARELGPIVVALLVVARSASAIAGEFASMAATAEVDALRAMGLDPVKYLVAPKIAALMISLPALTILSVTLIAVGGWFGATVFLGFGPNNFAEQFRSVLLVRDLAVGIGKSLLFAIVLGVIAADEGLSVERRVEAIGEAATRAVVHCLIAVLAVDTVINAIFYFIPTFL